MNNQSNAPEQPSQEQRSMQSTLEKLKQAAPLRKAQDAIENLFQERDNEGEVIQQSPVWMRATAYGLMGTAAFAVGWLALATTRGCDRERKLEPSAQFKRSKCRWGASPQTSWLKTAKT